MASRRRRPKEVGRRTSREDGAKPAILGGRRPSAGVGRRPFGPPFLLSFAAVFSPCGICLSNSRCYMKEQNWRSAAGEREIN